MTLPKPKHPTSAGPIDETGAVSLDDYIDYTDLPGRKRISPLPPLVVTPGAVEVVQPTGPIVPTVITGLFSRGLSWGMLVLLIGVGIYKSKRK